MRTCIIPGSFDPLTLGHLDVIRRATAVFDKVYVAIMVNSEKKGMFDFGQRKLIAEASCAGMPGVEIVTADGLLVDLCTALGACAIVKGVRNGADFDYEMSLAGINKFLAGGIETLWLPTAPEYSFICSAFVREMIRYGRSLDGVLHPGAINLIMNGFIRE